MTKPAGSNFKDFWTMTRHERRGTIVVLSLIALLLVATLAIRSCRSDAPPTDVVQQVERFEAQADSAAAVTADKPKRKTKGTKRLKKPHKSSPKPSSPPRNIDPVPQF